MNQFWQYIGLLRSILMYYGIPFRRRRLARFYAQFIQADDLCFDIGAHLGNRIRAWNDLGARVVALEPQPQCMSLLRRWYGHQPHVTLIEQAVGDAMGTQSLLISQRTPTVSTLSRDWIAAVQQAKSFAHVEWNESVPVTVTTLDALIAQYGTPAFCKIDVEGYELEVLQGLSQPIRPLSFEYIPATQESSQACLERLNDLADYKFNWSLAESHQLQSSGWLTFDEMANVLKQMPLNGRSGDVYAVDISSEKKRKQWS